jgi:SAM-dependent methyltransferase
MLATTRCVACGARALTPHLSVAGEAGPDGLIPSSDRYGTALADIARCRVCGHQQLDPMPAEAELSHAYAEAASEDYIQEEAGQRETARRALERIERHAETRGELLDLGCWVGFLLAEARDRGWRTVGVEPSAFASAYASERLGLEVVRAGLFEAPLPPSSFDLITMGDVIEHLVTPADALERVRGLMRPGGLVWLALPDSGSRLARAMGRRWWSVLPTHVQYFTRHSLLTLLGRCGFEPLEVATAPKAFTVRYYLERTAGYAPAISRGLVRAADATGLSDRIWAPDFRDRMMVIARAR